MIVELRSWDDGAASPAEAVAVLPVGGADAERLVAFEPPGVCVEASLNKKEVVLFARRVIPAPVLSCGAQLSFSSPLSQDKCS